jgi:uncharacterized membrane protein
MILSLLIGILFLATLLMPWVNHFRYGPIKDEIADIRREIRILQRKLSLMEGDPPASGTGQPFHVTPAEEDPEEDTTEFEPLPEEKPSRVPDKPAKRVQERKPYNFELNIGARLPVWIGAVSLICAAFFLVKYSMEVGWLGPGARVSLGALFGAALTGAGQWIIKKTKISNHERIAQGLVGAGLVSLYVSLYAAVNLYNIMPSWAGFGAMAAVTALAVILSLRHGQPIAAFGLIGGLLTPALVGSENPDALSLFVYLFLLFGSVIPILSHRGWWKLAIFALAGIFLWTAFWFSFAFTASNAPVFVFFIIAVCGAVLAATRNHILDAEEPAPPVHALNLLAITGSASAVVLLSFKITLSLFDWSMLGLLSLACMGLAYMRPDIYRRALWAKLGADLILLFIWSGDAALSQSIPVVSGLAIVYAVLPHFMARRDDPVFWAQMQCASSILLYLISYIRIDFAQDGLWSVAGFLLSGFAIHQAKQVRLAGQGHLVAIYALAATSFLSLGLSIMLPWSYLPLAFAAQTAATLWVYNRTHIEFLKKIAFILTLVFIGLNIEQIWLFGSLILGSIFKETPSLQFARDSMLDMPLIKLGLSAMFMGLALSLQRKQDNPDNRFSHILSGATLSLAIGAAYYLVRDIFQISPDFFSIRAGFVERGVITLIIAASGLALMRYTDFMKIWGMGLFHLAILRIAYFDLLILNPYLDNTQFVGDWPLVNGVTMIYGAGLLLSLWATRIWSRNASLIGNGYKALSLLLIFAFSSLTVRQYFHGGQLADGVMSNGELYGYSAAWLLTGLGLLAFGIAKQNKPARLASLAFMLLTIGKVFLFDAAELEGLHRVFSFLGLGISLIGLSFFYARFILGNGVQKDREL